MLKLITPSTEASWPYTHTADGSPAMHSAWSRFMAGLRLSRVSLAERRRLRRASGELARLDDRMLRDIGVTRSEIGRVVRFGRGD
jgi:uncharacterized protein YjiS (DUF1127 family)